MSSIKFYLKATLFSFLLLAILPGILTPILAEVNHKTDLETNTAYDKVHNGFVAISETLSNLLDIDTHIIALTVDKEYYFSVKFDNPNGIFLSVVVTNGVDIVARFGDWDTNTPKSQWKIVFVLTPTSTDEFSIVISELNGFDIIDTNYTLYANRSGFAGYWWMILIGLGAVLVLVLLIVVLSSVLRKKKKPKKRKRKK
ncbi:MAG: hypothetical protein KGD59_11525 [Candidatus Heimdallarchaeota archaeon]|nr:hypothetical protein [Candidatus Heimdallarchaeota archaeon]MBY8995173.1 hypothetical protein [Candidatus Heimdallarchaeota archaeon]